MGENWVKVRHGAGDGVLRSSDAEVRDIAARWDQFVEYVCLGLGQDLGRDVRPVRPRSQTSAARLEAHCKNLADNGALGAAIRVPDAAGDVLLESDLKARKIVTSVTLDAPGEGKATTRVNWLLKQLKEAPPGLVIEANFVSTKATAALRLDDARENLQGLLLAADPKRPPRSFRLTLAAPMGAKRGKGERSFVLETRKQTISFYRDLVQDLKPWRATAPKLPEQPSELQPEPAAEPPPFSAAREREPTTGEAPAG